MKVAVKFVRNARLRKRFRITLEQMWPRKASPLLSFIESNRGPRARMTRSWRARRIEDLQRLIVKSYKPSLRRWVKKIARKGEVRLRGKIPRNDKALEVRERLLPKYAHHHHLAYVSFQRGKCLKVGRSDKGLDRIANQWSNYFFRDASRVAVYFPTRNKKKILPALECALDHLYDPFHSYQKPSERKFREKCPACQQKKLLERLVKEFFPV